MKHKFGVIIFVPIGTKRLDPFQFDPEDPFCYHCGQKLMNVDLESVCPGPAVNSSNVKVYE